MLLLRPSPFSGESWPGYLLRLAEVNELRDIKDLCRRLAMPLNEVLCSKPQDVLEVIKREEPYRKRGLSNTSCRLHLHGRTNYTRICPLCFDNPTEPFVRAAWDRAFVWSCKIHQVALLEKCTRCGAEITYARTSVAACECGCPFRAMDANSSPDWTNALLVAFGIDREYAVNTATFEPSSELEIKAMFVLKQMLRITRGWQRRITNLRPSCFLSQDEAWELLPWFENWPRGFISELNKGRRSGLVPVPGRRFGIARIFPIFLEALQAVARHQFRSTRPGHKLLQGRSTVGLKYVLDRTGCHSHNVNHWIETGVFGSVEEKRLPNGNRSFVIPVEIAESVIAVVRQTSSIKELSISLGCEPLALRSMAQAGAIRQLSIGVVGGWAKRLLTDDAYSFAQRLLKLGRVEDVARPTEMSLPNVILWLRRRRVRMIPPLISSIEKGALKLTTHHALPVRLDELLMDRDEIQAWLDKAKAP